MPRGRKKTATPVETPVSTEITTVANDTAPVESPAAIASPAVEVPVTPATGTADERATVEAATATTDSPSPADEHRQNAERSAWADQAVTAFRQASGVDEEHTLCDLLANLMHWGDRHNHDFEAALFRAQDHYAAETAAARGLSTPGISGPEPGRFRSWVTDVGRGYHRLTDEQDDRLVLLFDAKPAADVLTAIKGAGFQYQPEYAGLKQAWVRRNDFEGRLQVEAIEKLIGTTPPRASAAR